MLLFAEPTLMDSPNFRPRQIVYLEHRGDRLYAEVIQVVEVRQRCWVRPLLLAILSTDAHSPEEPLATVDLRTSADLLWPVTLFQPALDTEVVAFLAMFASEPKGDRDPVAQQQLSQFIHQFWQAHKHL